MDLDGRSFTSDRGTSFTSYKNLLFERGADILQTSRKQYDCCFSYGTSLEQKKKRRKPTSSWKRQDPQVFTGQRELWRQQLESHGMLSCMRFEVVPAKFPCYKLPVWTSKSSSGHSHLHLYTKSFNSYSFVVLILVGWNCSQLRCSKGCPIIVRNMILFRKCFLEW